MTAPAPCVNSLPSLLTHAFQRVILLAYQKEGVRMRNGGGRWRGDAGVMRAIGAITAQYPGAVVSVGKVVGRIGKSDAAGSWRPCRSRIERDWSITVLIVGDEWLVRARVVISQQEADAP